MEIQNLRRKIGLLLALFSFFVTADNIVIGMLNGDICQHVYNILTPFAVGCVFLLSRGRLISWGEKLQFLTVMAIGLAMCVFGGRQQILSILVVIVGLGLGYRYRVFVLKKKPIAFWSSATVGSMAIGAILNQYASSVVTLFMFAGIAGIMLYWLFAEEIVRLSRDNEKLVPMAHLGESTAQLAHTSKSKIGVLHILLEMIESKDFDDEALGLMRVAVAGLDEFAKNLMRYARFSESTDRQMVNVRDVLASVVQILEYNPAFRKYVRFELECLGSFQMNVVPAEFKATMENLITNAAEAVAGNQGGKVRVRCDGSTIDVIDNGPGIPVCRACARPKDDCGTICHAFAIGRTSKQGGSGLGLVQAREYCRREGFMFVVFVTPDFGTRIAIHLNKRKEIEK